MPLSASLPQRSASLSLPVLGRLQSSPGMVQGQPEPASALSVPQALRSASLHPAEVGTLLQGKLAASVAPHEGLPEPLGQQPGFGSVGPEELHHALEGGPQPPYSLNDALDFRLMLSEAGKGQADHMIDELASQPPPHSDKVQQAMVELVNFKAKLVESMDSARHQVADLKSTLAASGANTAQQLRSIEQVMGGRIKQPNGLKSLWKFGFSENRRAKAQLAGLARAGKLGQPFAPPGPPVHLQAAMGAHLKGLLKRAGLSQSPQAQGLKAGLVQHMAKHAQGTAPWRTIDRPITLTGSQGQSSRFHNHITPAHAFSPQVLASYGAEQLGISCMNTTEPTRTVNLWKTEFQAEGSTVKFSALRHGIHDAYGIKNAEQRLAAADAKVAQFVQAAVDAYPDRLAPNDDGSYSLDMVSVSLVSPGKFGGEREMWQHQLGAYQRANDQPRVMDVDLGDGQGKRAITVKPRIIAFNTPVNSTALEKAAFRPFLGGLGTSGQTNVASITALLGPQTAGATALGGLAGHTTARLKQELAQAQAQGRDSGPLQGQIDRIEGLASQIRAIMNAPTDSDLSYHRAGREPYKLATRLVALGNELGAVAAFNCKSGKDRTGEADVQVKQLYARQHHDGAWPPVNEQASEQDMQNHARLVQEGGTFDIQKANTSLPGSKVEVKSVLKPLLKAMRAQLPEGLSAQERAAQVPKEAFKGLSAWVGS